MIKPKPEDIGRRVAFRKIEGRPEQLGRITLITKHFIFVKYDNDQQSKATRPIDLEWSDKP